MREVLRDQTREVRREPGCAFIQACRSARDPGQFFLGSRWVDEHAFQIHADLPATARFLARMEELSDRPLDVTRCRPL